MAKLSAKACQTITEIKTGTFRPRKASAKRGTYRLFAALPQHHFTTRYMPIDTTILHRLLSLCWKQYKYPDGVQGRVSEKEFRKEETKWWNHVFDLKPLNGVKVPEMPAGEGEEQQDRRVFSFLMETDCFGCSFTCYRPKRAAAPPLTPESAPLNEGETELVAIDLGLRDIATGIRARLVRDPVDEADADGQEEGR